MLFRATVALLAFVVSIAFPRALPTGDQNDGASTSSDPVEVAVLPLPPNLRDAAAVVSVINGAFAELRAGTNGFVCIADEPGDSRLSLECVHQGLLAYVERRRSLSSEMKTAQRDSVLALEVEEGSLSVPVGALSRYVSGSMEDGAVFPDSAWVWGEIALPFAVASGTGLPDTNHGAQPWLHHAGSVGAHVMVGYRKVPWLDVVGT